MARLKTGALERNLALTRLGLGAGAKIAAHSLANIFRGEVRRDAADRAFYQRQARILADELGQLKGSVMKAGQMLSLYGQYFLPEEAVQVLSGLQDNTPPVDWPVVAPVLERALGKTRLRELEIETVPMAAASLGQAHRARRRRDGLELCVKIQYPGVANAIESDIRTLSRLLLLTRLAPKGLDLAPVFAEVREMLHREVDYVAERRFTEDFAARLANDARFVVPRVLPEYSAERVLTTTFEHGLHVRDAAVQGLSQTLRNRLGSSFLELFLREFFEWGLVQSDPHFGNYRIRLQPDAAPRIVLLDFGATRSFSPAFIKSYADIVAGALHGRRAQLLDGARAIGLMHAQMPEPVLEAFCGLCQTIVEPFSGQRYDWGASDLPLRCGRMAALNSLSVHFRVPPREIVFLHRRMAGVFIMLATLRAVLDGRPELLHALDVLGSPGRLG